MDFIQCPQCGRTFEDDFYSCPECGCSFESRTRRLWKIVFWVMLILAGIGLLIGSVFP